MKGQSLIAENSLDDFAHRNAQPPSGRERLPFHVLYADCENIWKAFHHLVLLALGGKRHIFPITASNEQDIRFLWTQKHFHSVFLVLNNIIVQNLGLNPGDRIKSVLALIPWLRERSSATIIVFSGVAKPEIAEEAINGGADRFFPLPFPAKEVLDLLTERFAEPTEP